MTSYFTSSRSLATLAAALVALVASPAAAGVQVLVIDGDGALHCMTPPSCDTAGTACIDVPGTSCVPLESPAGAENRCVAPALVQYCCSTADDCPMVDGVLGRCVAPTDATFGSGLCAYEMVPSCLEADPRTDAVIITSCFRTTSGAATGPYGTVPWAVGDCDGDGVANMMDMCVCDPTNMCTMERDAGIPADVDAGPVQPEDAGPPEMPIDAGSGAIDANVPATTGLDFRGSGGCACEAAGTRSAAGGPLAALLAIGGLVASRIRRRSRGRSAALSA